VSLELSDQADIERAYAIAEAEGSEVIVEKFIRGAEHRVLVVGGKVVAANRGEVLWITGDGRSTVRALIDTQGAPKQVLLQRSSGHARLDQAALRAAMAARVKPRTENGVPFEFWIAMPLAFELE